MIRDDERFIFSLNTTVEMHPLQAPAMTMQEIVERLFDRYNKGEAVKLIENAKASLRIHKMEIDSEREVAILLIHYYDTRGSDPVFGDLIKGELRKESKLSGEGIAVSAHFAVSLKPTKPRGNVYMTSLEEMPGLGRTRLSPFLQSEIRAVAESTFIENETEKKCWPQITLESVPSIGLEEDIKSGKFKGISLIKHEIRDFMDEESIMVPVRSTLDLKVKQEKKKKIDPAQEIRRMFSLALDNGYSGMVVHFETSHQRSKSVPISLKIEDAMSVAFTRMHEVSLSNPIAQCEPDLNPEIKNEMISLLLQAGSNDNSGKKNKAA